MPRRANPPSQPDPSATQPSSLAATTFEHEGEVWLVLSHPLVRPELPPTLTEAEREIVEGLAAGEVNEELARTRGTSVRTVANQVASIFKKLGVSSRAELLAVLHRPR